MELIKYLFDLFIHLDKHLNDLIIQYEAWTYLILFLVIFAETGFVLTPFLPGDSLLFAAGTFAAIGSFNIVALLILLYTASILGDNTNYWIGYFVGPKIFHREKVRFLKKEYLERTHQFYEKNGGKTIIIAKYIPIIRTFAPFVAGIGKMTYPKFLAYDVTGGLTWVSIFCLGGYFFGNLSFVKNNFSIVIVVIILISLMPGFVEYLRHKSVKQT